MRSHHSSRGIESYFKRIGYHGSRQPSIDVLRGLHRRHLLSIPFENLDIHLARPILLDQRLFYRKIVEDGRGGYCYELNGLFAWLLKSLGFKVSMLSARVARKSGGFSPEFDHMTLLVHLKNRWLADVGFAELFTLPKLLDSRDAQRDDGRVFRFTGKDDNIVLLRRSDGDKKWEPQYAFSLRPRKLADFGARNRYQQTSSRSHFTQGRLISILTTKGRVTLTDRRLIVTSDRKRVEHTVRNRKEFAQLLFKHFQIHLG